jgi:hypothetical protein
MIMVFTVFLLGLYLPAGSTSTQCSILPSIFSLNNYTNVEIVTEVYVNFYCNMDENCFSRGYPPIL